MLSKKLELAPRLLVYLRATAFPPAGSTRPANVLLADALSEALRRRRYVADTTIKMDGYAEVSVRKRKRALIDKEERMVRLQVRAGRAVSHSTMGKDKKQRHDTDHDVAPPENRTFRNADAYCRIRGNEIVACLDGMRENRLQSYLNRLLELGATSAAPQFYLAPVRNMSTEANLARKSISKVHIRAKMYAASAALEQGATPKDGSVIKAEVRNFLGRVKNTIRAQAPKVEEEMLDHGMERVNVSLKFTLLKGVREDHEISPALEALATEALDDEDRDVLVALEASDGTKIKRSQIIHMKRVNLPHRIGADDLAHEAVWHELDVWEIELRRNGLWGK